MGEVRELEFAFDIASPHAYLASKQIEGVALRTGATLLWTPVLLEDLYNLNGRGFFFVCLFVCFSFLVHPLSISTLF
jgi:2-hydroxychromene-2-carboxylate isomerase